MEKNGAVAIVASKATSKEAPILIHAPVKASKAATILVQTPVPASTIAVCEEALDGLGKIPLGWDPYEEDDYIRPENPYDTSITDPWSELTREDSSDDESKDSKTRQVLRRLKSGQYDNFFIGDVYRCPLCTTRRLHSTKFNSLVKHAEDVRTCDESMNVHNFISKHRTLAIHLRNLQKVAIEEGCMLPIKPKAPKVKGLDNKKWRMHQREEATVLLAKAMRGY